MSEEKKSAQQRYNEHSQVCPYGCKGGSWEAAPGCKEGKRLRDEIDRENARRRALS